MTDAVPVIPAHDITVADDVLSWKDSSGNHEAKLQEIPFVVSQNGPNGTEYIICRLQDTDGYQLHLLSCSDLPPLLVPLILEGVPRHLRLEERDVDVIVSVKSGTGLALQFWENVLSPLLECVQQRSGSSQSQGAIITTSAESVLEYAKNFQAKDEPTTIILLSGDGGVIDLVNGLDAQGPPNLAILPLGTGNALFHSMHKPLYRDSSLSPLVLGLRTVFQGTPAPLPIFKASFEPSGKLVSFDGLENQDPSTLTLHETPVTHLNGAIVASYGFHSSIVYESDTPEYRAHGDKRFGMVAQELLQKAHGYQAKVTIKRPGSEPETLSRDKHAYILAAAVSNLERAFTISPESQPLDGKLRLVHFGTIGGQRTMDVMMKAYDGGKHVGMSWDDGEAVGYEEIEEVEVTILEEDPRWRKVCIDGKIVELPVGGKMTVRRASASPVQIFSP